MDGFRKAQDLGGIRAAFSLDTFFSTAWMQEVGQRMEQLPRPRKRKYLACRCENRLQHKPVAIATLILMASDKP